MTQEWASETGASLKFLSVNYGMGKHGTLISEKKHISCSEDKCCLCRGGGVWLFSELRKVYTLLKNIDLRRFELQPA